MSFKTLKDLTREELLSVGHRCCEGCGIPHVVRYALKARRGPVAVVNATGCLEVCTSPYPYSSWMVPYVHTLFENTAAVASGIVETVEKLHQDGRAEKLDVIVFAGDGGTFDIGLQALSGAMERGHDFLYICYDNEAYMNTGNQRSGATPQNTFTSTTPVGKIVIGKPQKKKDIIGIALTSGAKYAATAAIHNWRDYMTKVRKALDLVGPAFIHILQPCQTGWRYDPAKTLKMSRMAVDTKVFPLYEVENGKYKINYRPTKVVPLEDYLRAQRRYAHLFLPENIHLIENIKRNVEESWARLERLEKCTAEQGLW